MTAQQAGLHSPSICRNADNRVFVSVGIPYGENATAICLIDLKEGFSDMRKHSANLAIDITIA